MILTPCAPLFDYLTHCRASANRVAYVSVFRVMFGWRVRAGLFANVAGSELDWCGGGHWPDVERLYSLAAGILTQRIEDNRCFDGIPGVSTIKPFYRDMRFLQTVCALAGPNCPLITLDKPNITALNSRV